MIHLKVSHLQADSEIASDLIDTKKFLEEIIGRNGNYCCNLLGMIYGFIFLLVFYVDL